MSSTAPTRAAGPEIEEWRLTVRRSASRSLRVLLIAAAGASVIVSRARSCSTPGHESLRAVHRDLRWLSRVGAAHIASVAAAADTAAADTAGERAEVAVVAEAVGGVSSIRMGRAVAAALSDRGRRNAGDIGAPGPVRAHRCCAGRGRLSLHRTVPCFLTALVVAVIAERQLHHLRVAAAAEVYRRALRQRGVVPRIARRGVVHGSGLGRTRCVVERTFAGGTFRLWGRCTS